jgi:hypothetical protein
MIGTWDSDPRPDRSWMGVGSFNEAQLIGKTYIPPPTSKIVAEVVWLEVDMRALYVWKDEDEDRIYRDLVDVVGDEIGRIDSLVEEVFDTSCLKAEVFDYKDYFKVVVEPYKIGEVDAIKEFYVRKVVTEVIVIPVRVVVGEYETTVALAQYFITPKGCYKYHRIKYDVIEDVAKAMIRETFLEEVAESGDKSG